LRSFRPAIVLAAAVAIVLGPHGCKPSSLTPFGIGEQDYSASGGGFNGVWQGTTSTGGTFAFQIAGNKIVSFTSFPLGPTVCPTEIFAINEPIPIENDAFTIDLSDGNDRFVAEGRFSSETECSGTYRIELHSTVGGCSGTGSGSFVATKAP
jgi:hypothetical protein